MGSLFAAVSGTFTKPILFGMLFPTLLFLVFFSLLVSPMLPWEPEAMARVAALDPEWKLAAFTLATIVISVLLYTLNSQVIRWYQGYPWMDGPIGQWLIRLRREPLEWEVKLLPHLDKCREGVDELITAEEDRIRKELRGAQQVNAIATLQAHQGTLAEQLDRGQRIIVERHFFEYPKLASVLPTDFGNRVRSFENYAYRQYNIAAVPLWPRFRAKLDSGYAASIDDAKSHVDLSLNLSLLSGILFLLILFLGVLFGPVNAPQWVAKLAGTAFTAWVMYRVAVDRSMDWGNLVRGAFDLYRSDVLKALGFRQEPRTLEEERELWAEISRQYGYGDPVDGTIDLEFRDAPAIAAPLTVAPPEKIRLTRGVGPLRFGARTIYTRIDNADANPAKVIVKDKLDGQDYMWASAKVGGNAIEPKGTNPYEFEMTVPANGSVVLEYQVSEPARA
ncbi:MAG TPA: hypothetical protein VNI54_07695 [Thermoanaerobaculia bacterium]|nr:hypothetical protein [Thermoanaerobaculia bacterium]